MPAKVKQRKVHSLLGNTYKSLYGRRRWRVRATIGKKSVIGPWRCTKTQADADLAIARSKPSRLEFKKALRVLMRKAHATRTSSSVHVASIKRDCTKKKTSCRTKPSAKHRKRYLATSPCKGQGTEVPCEVQTRSTNGTYAKTMMDSDSAVASNEQHIQSSSERWVLLVD